MVGGGRGGQGGSMEFFLKEEGMKRGMKRGLVRFTIYFLVGGRWWPANQSLCLCFIFFTHILLN